MKRLLLLLTAGLTVVLPAGPATAQPAPATLTVTDIDTGAHPQITAVVTAPAELMEVALDGGAIEVAEGDRRLPATLVPQPVDDLEVVLVIDTSGSMAGEPITAARAAAASFLQLLPAPVRVGVVAFGASPTVVAPVSTDREAALAAVRDLGARGETSLYDAVALAAQQFSPGARRSVVLLSDGADTASTIDVVHAAAALVAADVHLDVAELVSDERNHEALGLLAEAGGGRVVPATDPAALSTIYGDIAVSLVSRYRVTWRSEASGPTDLVLSITAGDVRAEGRLRAELPAVPALPTTVPAPAPPPTTVDVVAGRDPVVGEWALAAGAAAVFTGLVLVGLLVANRDEKVGRRRLGTARERANTPKGSILSNIAHRATAAADRALVDGRHGGRLHGSLEAAGIALRPGELVVMVAAGMGGALLLGLLLGGVLAGLAMAIVVLLVAVFFVRIAASRRRAQFAEALPETLQLLSGTLRSGYALLQSVDAVAREAEGPTRDEFRRVVVETRLGRDLTVALHAVGERMRSDDWEWVSQAIDINREVGGDLAEVLDNVGSTIRDRGKLQRQVKALSAEGRMSAWVLIGLPFLIYGAMRLMNPDYIDELHHGAGLVAVAVALVAIGVGAVWLRKICKLVV